MMRVSSLLRHSRLTGARGHNRTRPAFYALNKYRKRAGVGMQICGAVAKRQTRKTRNLVASRLCEFNSRPPHQTLVVGGTPCQGFCGLQRVTVFANRLTIGEALAVESLECFGGAVAVRRFAVVVPNQTCSSSGEDVCGQPDDTFP